jgi:hypothetical protein
MIVRQVLLASQRAVPSPSAIAKHRDADSHTLTAVVTGPRAYTLPAQSSIMDSQVIPWKSTSDHGADPVAPAVSQR